MIFRNHRFSVGSQSSIAGRAGVTMSDTVAAANADMKLIKLSHTIAIAALGAALWVPLAVVAEVVMR